MASQEKKERTSASEVDRQIDENLRRVFDDAAAEPLPDRFTDLIAKLKSKEGDTSNGN
ncbi:hypothetical protein JANAI62_24960 [Jannaschia pagri]|uniref:Anti-sigma factor NepR domain-containing protein n=1 Tax=Jannaschia pagri TaxID=2829797 RepID=A0ABQ4NN78_9RHOB|nr:MULTISPECIES: NepR family anti-sigma factor [unclassified Jannaschia]GIT92039.1 hypothetical protein JANAI61_24970 [Jannaschia sp. AI_61]GIT95873.1 hypothetical protein JANAI62_24960 [Jannaschia sp. AI_62]